VYNKNNQTLISQDLSQRIISLRFLLIVSVVIRHSGINEKTFEESGIHAIIPAYVLSVQSLVGIITAVAVPLFFLISGYLLYIKETEFLPVLKKKCRTILMPYFMWNILLIGFYFTVSTLSFAKQFFPMEKPISSWGIIDWVKAFIGKYGKYGNFRTYPFVYQFWFLRDLFIVNLLFVIIKKLVDKFPLAIFVLFSALWVSHIKLYIIDPVALLFFAFGYYLVKYNLNEKNIDQIKTIDLLACYGTTIVLEYLFKDKMPVISNINIIIGCIFFLKIAKYFIENTRLYASLSWLEKYQFVVYAIHEIIIPPVFEIYIRIVPLNGVFILLDYFCMILCGVFVSLMFGVILKKLFPKTNAILTGGRV
jgi:fucose 4-O-acetylase-like acetyltransferase